MLKDSILLWKSKRGDQEAFERIYCKYLDDLLTVGRSLLGNRQEAEDVVQDVFVKWIETLDSFHLRGSLKAFLATCVANRARDLIRKRNRQGNNHGELISYSQHDKTPYHEVDHEEQLQMIQRALNTLSYEQREIISLKIHTNLSFRTLARGLELPLGTVQARYRYGMNRLRQLLDSEETS